MENIDRLRELTEELSSKDRELEQAYDRYENFIRNSSEGIWRSELRYPIPVDLSEDEMMEIINRPRSAYIAEANEAMARMYKMSVEELLEAGGDLNNLLPIEENDAYLRKFLRNGFRVENELSVERDAEGNIIYFMNSMVGEVEDGHLVRVWGVQRDVTKEHLVHEELRRQKEIYQMIVENIGDLLGLLNMEGLILFASPSYKTVLGYSGEELVGMNVFDLIHPDDLERARRAFAEVLKTRHAVQAELRLRRKTGRYVRLESVGVAIRGKDGNVEMVLSLGRLPAHNIQVVD